MASSLKATDIYAGSNGSVTRDYYARLEARGPLGFVAMNLFRAQKTSSRAKKYRGGIRGVGSFSKMAYDTKNFSLKQLCDALLKHGDGFGITFGWKVDPRESFASWVLYVDLPNGQVSFHCTERYAGPDYPGEWDQQHASQERMLAFCDSVYAVEPQLWGRPTKTVIHSKVVDGNTTVQFSLFENLS
jgi:hypothetical protein